MQSSTAPLPPLPLPSNTLTSAWCITGKREAEAEAGREQRAWRNGHGIAKKKVLRAANNTALLAPPLKRGVPLQPSTGSSRSSGGASRGPPQPPEPMRHVAVGEGEAGEGEAGPKH